MVNLILRFYLWIADVDFLICYYAGLISWRDPHMSKSKKGCKPKPKGTEVGV